MKATELLYEYYTCSKMFDYVQNDQPFRNEENEALLELLTDELDEVYKELQEYIKNKMDEGNEDG
tara:strand:- start:1944 stop:2138 length:195 start_codon:yes stop_codon:yes gene_type:complete